MREVRWKKTYTTKATLKEWQLHSKTNSQEMPIGEEILTTRPTTEEGVVVWIIEEVVAEVEQQLLEDTQIRVITCKPSHKLLISSLISMAIRIRIRTRIRIRIRIRWLSHIQHKPLQTEEE